MEKKKKTGIDLGLSKDDKATLYAIARTAIENSLAGNNPPSGEVTSDILREKRGAFVSLHLHGNLRVYTSHQAAV
jgi:AMMECR1 domain-containing protein